MRFLKLTSDKNPDNDFILLNGGYFDKYGNKNKGFYKLQGFLCTSFQTLGMARRLDMLAVGNRQFSVDNKIDFKKYVLTIEILENYNLYENKYRELVDFLDRNKKTGFRLYYRASDKIRYCLCDIMSVVKTERMQAISLTLSQNSLWIGEDKKATTTAIAGNENDNIFAFESEGDEYYSAKFYEDKDIANYYSISFYNTGSITSSFANDCWNEIPLTIRIYGKCVNPYIGLYRKGETKPIRQLEIKETINANQYIEINSNINKNGVCLVDALTGKKEDYSNKIANEYGSPYWYIDNGEYYIEASDDNNNVFECVVLYNEEYND